MAAAKLAQELFAAVRAGFGDSDADETDALGLLGAVRSKHPLHLT